MEVARHRRSEHLVYASSSSVYGGNTKLPFSVDDRVDHPMSLYAATFADIAAIQRDLGFEPQTAIAEGVPSFVDWYRDYHGLG